jgi:hypothetical protein
MEMNGHMKMNQSRACSKKINSMHLGASREYTLCWSINTLVGVCITADDNTTRMIYT